MGPSGGAAFTAPREAVNARKADEMSRRRILVAGMMAVFALALPTAAMANTARPASPVKLVFIHHSTGENWLSDTNGGLGVALRDRNYFVSDTNYGWGDTMALSRDSEPIGSTTDIGDWYTWFRGSAAASYTAALYAESGQNCSYSRLATDPGGDNEIIVFKSCFPNSALQGNPGDAPPAIDSNLLRGQSCYSGAHTVANAKGIYIDLLNYFAAHQEKLFVVVAAPPLQDATWSANARVFNNWLVNDWLTGYGHDNVFVFDFYNVLTTNGGASNKNDLLSTSGNHHRIVRGGVIQHKTDGDGDSNPNVLEYPSSGGDDHPSYAGNLKATAEFVPLLNYAYNRWKGIDGTDSVGPTTIARRAATLYRRRYGNLLYRVDDTGSVGAVVTIRIKRSGRVMATYALGLRRTNKMLYVRLRTALPRGLYYYCVYATDEAGNPQRRVGCQRLYLR